MAAERYTPYAIVQNPFPASPSPGVPLDEIIDQKDAIATIDRIVNDCRETGDTAICMILADIGNGKTLVLKKLEERIQGFNTFKITSLVLRRAYTGLDLFIETIKQFNVKELGLILRKYFDEFGLKEIEKEVRSDDFLRVLNILCGRINGDKTLAWNWLKGLPLTASQRSRMGVFANLKFYEELGIKALSILIKIIGRINRYKISILLDEFENLRPFFPKSKRLAFLEDLRYLLDWTPKGLLLLLACTPEGWENLKADSPSLSSRLKRYAVTFRNFGEKEAAELIAKTLSLVRTSDFKGSALFPFEKSGVREIVRQTRGIVRDIIESCYMIIEYGCDHGHPRIDDSIVRKALQGKKAVGSETIPVHEES